MGVQSGNLFADMPIGSSDESFAELLSAPGVKIERIVSMGQATPALQWLDQDCVEWVALLSGAAGVWFENEAHPRVLKPGDWLEIPAHARHRVEWTDANTPTVWLAIHIQSPSDHE